ncbi:MAG: amidohydrolase family protein [Acidobacteria bacterium]|nr:amidohydrolase family protein [Acidobacteriota bacterium]MBI3658016.1 amidohydrolase family protein [Acidobacteriota bacterium]
MKNRLAYTLGRLTLSLIIALAGAAPLRATAEKMPLAAVLVKNASIWTQAPQGMLKGDLLVRAGKIVAVGAHLTAPEGAAIIDATGKHITPGLIDCHSHSMTRGGLNEGSNNVTAEVRVADILDPEDISIYRELAGGLTVANILHGSANSIGGQNAVVKLKWQSTADALRLTGAPPGIKFALGENPKRSAFTLPGADRRYPATRMGVEESIRERFLAARDYAREWDEYNGLSEAGKARREPPRRDLQLEAIAEILNGNRWVHSHSYRQDEILALIRLAEDFNFRIATFQHVLEGYKVADEMAAHGAGASTFSDWWAFKLEAYDAIPYNGTIMAQRGVSVSFNSDSGELARRLNLEAAKAVKYGDLDETEALNFVTLNPAKQLGIAHRVGSIEPGKDADYVIWSGHPFSVYSVAEQTWVDGIKEFDRQEDLAQRPALEKVRDELIEKVKQEDKKPERKDLKDVPLEKTGGPVNREGQPPKSGAVGEPALTKTEVADTTTIKSQRPPDAKEKVRPKRPIPPVQPAIYRDRLASISDAYAIVSATIHTLTHGDIENGTVVFEKGKITALGSGLAPPARAKVIDGQGKHVYPGLIAADTAVGLVEIGSVSGSVDVAEIGSVNPNLRAEISVNPDSELIPVARANGITHALTAPSGGLISGASALIRLDGWTWEDLTASAPVAMHIQWPRFGQSRFRPYLTQTPGAEEDLKKVREQALKAIRQAFEDARAYQKAKNAAGKNGAKPLKADPVWEAMLPVLEGKVPVVVHAGELRQIKSAVEWAEEEGVRIIIAGMHDLWRAADLLKQKNIPVILTGTLALPARRDEPYDSAYSVAAKLHAAGVKFCIAGHDSGRDASNTRNLPYHAGMAAAFGLPRAEALKAITLYPAQILGLEAALGSIEVGKSASLIITDGDPLEIRTKIIAEFIDGRPVALENNKHYKLYQKYIHRPKLAPPGEDKLAKIGNGD